ncbi:hypothetical protein HKX48_001788 [Thoreauomyces humboldtii]|nr:hypothetical protein HKX48_001788 [Thoreauomyces humboldtii]
MGRRAIRLLWLGLMLSGVTASSTPHVCTFPSTSSCSTFTGGSCMEVDQLPTVIASCARNDEPQLFSSSGFGQVCTTFSNCSATTQAVVSGDLVPVNGLEYTFSSGTTLTLCPDTICSQYLPTPTLSAKVQLISSPQLTLLPSGLTGVSYVVVGQDAWVTSDSSWFYKAASNPPSLNLAINPGKEVLSSTPTQTVGSYNYVPVTGTDLVLDSSVCAVMIRFDQGDVHLFAGYTLVNYKSTSGGYNYFTIGMASGSTVTSAECQTLKDNSSSNPRYFLTIRVFVDSNGNGIAYLTSDGALFQWLSGAWVQTTAPAGCLSTGLTYFKVSGVYTVYSSTTCALNPSVNAVVATPLYDFPFGSLTITASMADQSSQTCFGNGTASYSLGLDPQGNLLNRFSAPLCAANPTIDASATFSSLPGNCSSLNATDYAVSDNTIVQFQSAGYSCATPTCIDVGSCQTESCLYNEGLMAGNVNCSTIDGLTQGMVYVRDPVTSTTTSTTKTPTTTTTDGTPTPTESLPGDCIVDDVTGTFVCSGARSLGGSGWTGPFSVAVAVGAGMAVYLAFM